MTNRSTFDFIVDREARTITIRRAFAAERSLVWDAYTRSEILDQWWAPKPWKLQTKTMDFREGGSWIYAMISPEGAAQWVRAYYTSIRPLERFTGGDGFTDAEGNLDGEMPQSEWTVTFSDKGAATLVEYRMAYDNPEALEASIQMGMEEGWSLALDGLDELFPALRQEINETR